MHVIQRISDFHELSFALRQNKFSCETIHVFHPHVRFHANKTHYLAKRFFHEDSFWNRGKRQLVLPYLSISQFRDSYQSLRDLCTSGRASVSSSFSYYTVNISTRSYLLNALANEDTLLLMMFLGLRKLGNICCGHKMFLNKIRSIFCVPDTKFVSATNVARAGKRVNNCVGNNVSATLRSRLPGP